MADIVERAFEAIRRLAPERRDERAGLLLRLAAEDDDPEAVDPAHLSAVLEGRNWLSTPTKPASRIPQCGLAYVLEQIPR